MIAKCEAVAPDAASEENCYLAEPDGEAVTFPKLHLLVPGSERAIADLVVPLAAQIVGPVTSDGTKPTLNYFEAICTSSATAHAVAGALVEHRLDLQLSLKRPGACSEWQFVAAPEQVRIQDTRLTVTGWDRYVHHVAVLDRSSNLIVVDSDGALWRKLRTRMTLPTLEAWGEYLLPLVKQSGLLLPTQTFGLSEGLAAYLLAPDATETFDRIVSRYVREHGLSERVVPTPKRLPRIPLRKVS